MEIITKTELQLRYEEVLQRIQDGAVFIKPTDTIYGLSCNALNKKAVEKIREIKDRATNPFSVVAPSLDWIRKNCFLDKKALGWLDKLPGPYTLITKLKNKKAVAENVNSKMDTLGVRFPDHWVTTIAADLDLPLVTTSVNKTGDFFMTSLEDLNEDIKNHVDFILYEGEKKSRPSKIVDLSTGNVKER